MNWKQLLQWKTEKKKPALRGRAVNLLVGFLVFMFLFTMLSRAAINLITPAVSSAAPEQKPLSYEITAAGTVTESKMRAVHVPAGMQIKNIPVKEGDPVQKGDVLLELDLEDLNQKITQKELEIKKLTLGIGDIQVQKSQQQQEKQQERQRAEEDYQRARQDTQNSVQRAWQDMTEAQSRLSQWIPLGDDSTEEEKALNQQQKTELEEACSLALLAYDEAVRTQEETLTSSLRKVEDAQKPETPDSTAEIMQMDKQVHRRGAGLWFR